MAARFNRPGLGSFEAEPDIDVGLLRPGKLLLQTGFSPALDLPIPSNSGMPSSLVGLHGGERRAVGAGGLCTPEALEPGRVERVQGGLDPAATVVRRE